MPHPHLSLGPGLSSPRLVRRLPPLLLISLCALWAAFGAPGTALPVAHAAAPNQWGTVTRIEVGLQTRLPTAARWTSSYVGAALFDEELVQTGDRERAVLLFRDGLVANINSNTEVRVKDPRHVHLTAGEIFEQVVTGKGKREVDTGAAVASVEGTKFDVQVHGNVTILTVVQHTVRFSNKYGSVVVQQDQQSTATTTSAPTPPVTVDARKVVAWAGSSGWT